jgi:hypothetical protein
MDMPTDGYEPAFEYSSLTSEVTREGITVFVNIYRRAGDDHTLWTLEVICELGSTVWDETFEDDTDAYAEFIRILESRGIKAFASRSAGTLH